MTDGLTWTGFTLDDLIEEFEQSSAFTRRESKKVIRQGAKDIMTASQQMCPVDEHNLEQAHHIQDIRSNQDEIKLEIDVGGIVGGRDVDEYAVIMHQGLAPYGDGSAGTVRPTLVDGSPSKSYEKSQSNPSDRAVGGKFLERAVDLYEEKILNQLAMTLPGDAK